MSQPEPVPLDPELTEIESTLGSLSPARSRLDRDRLMFLAGQAQAAPRRSVPARWAWPAIAASLAVIALGEAALLAQRPEPRVVERLVVVREPAPPEPTVDPLPPVLTSAPEEQSPVVILSQRPREQRFTPTSEPSWPAEGSSAWLRLQVLRFGPDALSEPPPLAMRPVDEGPASSAQLLRSEIDRILNPGEPS